VPLHVAILRHVALDNLSSLKRTYRKTSNSAIDSEKSLPKPIMNHLIVPRFRLEGHSTGNEAACAKGSADHGSILRSVLDPRGKSSFVGRHDRGRLIVPCS